MRSTTDGFIIAEKDLRLRGSGEFLGSRQTGYRQFKFADLARDEHLLPKVTETARELMENNQDLARRIAHRWLGQFEQYLQG